MTQKEIYEMGIDITTFLDIVLETQDAAEAANAATEMIKGILTRSPKIRHEIYELGRHDLLDEMGVNYGAP